MLYAVITEKIKNAKKNLQELQDILTVDPEDIDTLSPGIDHINGLINRALTCAKALKSSTSPMVASFPSQVELSPGERLKKQPRFQRTTKKKKFRKHVLRLAKM